MSRKVKISFLIVVWSIVAIQMYVNYQERMGNMSRTVPAFAVADDTNLEETIKGYGYFGTMTISDKIRKTMLENLAYKLGITDGYVFSAGNGDGFDKIVLTKEGKYATTVLQVISMEQKQGEPEQYIVMEISTREKAAKALSLYQKVKRIYEEIGVDGQVSLEISMEQEGNTAAGDKGDMVEEIFNLAKAKKVDTIKENGIYTVYGYTRLEDTYLNLQDKKVNIQMVMSYDEKEDKTYVKMGIPMVNSSY